VVLACCILSLFNYFSLGFLYLSLCFYPESFRRSLARSIRPRKDIGVASSSSSSAAPASPAPHANPDAIASSSSSAATVSAAHSLAGSPMTLTAGVPSGHTRWVTLYTTMYTSQLSVFFKFGTYLPFLSPILCIDLSWLPT
jgi:hypothetical protein